MRECWERTEVKVRNEEQAARREMRRRPSCRPPRARMTESLCAHSAQVPERPFRTPTSAFETPRQSANLLPLCCTRAALFRTTILNVKRTASWEAVAERRSSSRWVVPHMRTLVSASMVDTKRAAPTCTSRSSWLTRHTVELTQEVDDGSDGAASEAAIIKATTAYMRGRSGGTARRFGLLLVLRDSFARRRVARTAR